MTARVLVALLLVAGLCMAEDLLPADISTDRDELTIQLGCTDRIAQLEARVAELERQLNASQQWRAVVTPGPGYYSIDPPRDWPYPGARYAIIDVPVAQYQDSLWRGGIAP